VVGELHSFSGSKENVIAQYKKILDDKENAGILFMNGDSWPLDSILWDWRGEFLDQNHIEEGKYYIVYLSGKFPAFFDLRCRGY
jgi:spore coat polysaccharide biosynthesis protein SpsF (cytidylyltransferase family)